MNPIRNWHIIDINNSFWSHQAFWHFSFHCWLKQHWPVLQLARLLEPCTEKKSWLYQQKKRSTAVCSGIKKPLSILLCLIGLFSFWRLDVSGVEWMNLLVQQTNTIYYTWLIICNDIYKKKESIRTCWSPSCTTGRASEWKLPATLVAEQVTNLSICEDSINGLAML